MAQIVYAVCIWWGCGSFNVLASDVVKVKGEDPATTGSLRGDMARRYVGNSHSWVHNDSTSPV